jgi:hypothetical protein
MLKKQISWRDGTATNQEDYERRLLLAYDIILGVQLPEDGIISTGTTPVEEVHEQRTDIRSRQQRRAGKGMES